MKIIAIIFNKWRFVYFTHGNFTKKDMYPTTETDACKDFQEHEFGERPIKKKPKQKRITYLGCSHKFILNEVWVIGEKEYLCNLCYTDCESD